MLEGKRGVCRAVRAVLDLAFGVELEAFLTQSIAHTLRELGGAFGQILVIELDDLATIHADEVIVVGVLAMDRVIALAAVAEVFFHGEALFDEEFERAVDRGIADALLALLDLGVELVSGDVFIELEEAFGDGVALLGRLQRLVLELGMECLHCGGDLLIGGRDLFEGFIGEEITHKRAPRGKRMCGVADVTRAYHKGARRWKEERSLVIFEMAA